MPRPHMPTVTCPQLVVDVDFSSLIGSSAFVDVVFDIHGVLIGAHSACLAISSSVFSDLLSIVVLGKDTSDVVRCCSGNQDMDSVECKEPSITLDHPVFVSFVRPTLAKDGSIVPAKVIVSDAVSLSAFRVVLHFFYAGTLPPLLPHWCPLIHHLAELLAIPSLERAVANISVDEDFLNVEVYRSISEERYRRSKSMLLQDGMFSGTCLCSVLVLHFFTPSYSQSIIHDVPISFLQHRKIL